MGSRRPTFDDLNSVLQHRTWTKKRVECAHSHTSSLRSLAPRYTDKRRPAWRGSDQSNGNANECCLCDVRRRSS
jgi:hypothetical protein